MSLTVDSASPSRKSPRGIPVALIIAGVLAIVGIVIGWLMLRGGPQAAQAPVLTPAARSYVRAGYLQLSDVKMEAKENFARQMLVEITGRISNSGDRELKMVELTCVFHDPAGQVIMRERVPIVKAQTGLRPRETRDFRLPFDTIPQSWNQALPDLVIAQIAF